VDSLYVLRGRAFANFAVTGFCFLWNAIDEKSNAFDREARRGSAAKDAKRTKTWTKLGSKTERNTKLRRMSFVLLRLSCIRTSVYIQRSNLRPILEAKYDPKPLPRRRPGCSLRRRKRPWHRRSVPRWSEGSYAAELRTLQPVRTLLRFFNDFHGDTTT